ncbi:MAG: universal stress protein [Saprospiraceae bacterium]|nr:MAG: universal stress protein [Saprospiraceae bacterium]
MGKLKKILLPTDFSETSENAFRYALMIADRFDAEVKLLHVVYPEAEPMDFPVMIAQMTQKRLEVAQQVMKTFVDRGLVQITTAQTLKRVPIIHSEVEIGTPVHQITQMAQNEAFDLIVMGTMGEHSRLEKLFGSTTVGTLRRAKCPVWVVPEKAGFNDIRNVAYATDLQENDLDHIWQTTEILKQFNPFFRIVHIETENDKKPSLKLKELVGFFEKQFPELGLKCHNVKGQDLITELNEFADLMGIDLLIMYRPKRGFLENLFHESVTKRTVYHAHVPILILH